MIFILWDLAGGNIWNRTEPHGVMVARYFRSAEIPPKLSLHLPKPARRDVVMLISLPPSNPARHFLFSRSPLQVTITSHYFALIVFTEALPQKINK